MSVSGSTNVSLYSFIRSHLSITGPLRNVAREGKAQQIDTLELNTGPGKAIDNNVNRDKDKG